MERRPPPDRRPPPYPAPATGKTNEVRKQIRQYRTSWLYKPWILRLDTRAGLVAIVAGIVGFVACEVMTFHRLASSDVTTNDIIEMFGRDGLVLLALIVAIFARRAQIRVRRFDRGECVKCGYNLRASKDRCPECGTPIPI